MTQPPATVTSASPPPKSGSVPRRAAALTIMWIVWAALLAGQILFGGIILLIQSTGLHPTLAVPASQRAAWMIAIAAVILAASLGGFARGEIYKRFWRAHAVTGRGYLLGNVVFMMAIHAAAACAAIAILLTAQVQPAVWAWAVALAIMVINFPTGAPLRPHQPPEARQPEPPHA